LQRALQVDLDNTDVAILKSLMEDGRKSFRAISREIKVSTPPTVKSRYERLVNIGLTKSVKPEIDLSKVTRGKKKSQFFGGGGGGETIKQLEEQKKHFHVKVVENMKVKDAMRILWRTHKQQTKSA
jgi:DNA-binding Lrp family transcriptional regulator